MVNTLPIASITCFETKFSECGTPASRKLSDVITARRNKRVVTIGIGKDINTQAMSAMGNAGFLNPATYAELDAELATLTGRLSTLNKSIYKANYCSPKRAGQHELVFTVKGNDAAVKATCPIATFTPGASCNNPNFTEVCASVAGGTRCCGADTPFACIATDHCFATAEAAAKECATSCLHCGGTGQPQMNQSEGGPAIRVTFQAQGYTSTQCPAFRGPSCKALATCCASLPGQLQTQCNQQLDSLQGNEAQCASQKASQCPAVGPECSKTQTCCKTFGSNVSAQCWNQTTQGNEAACTAYSAQNCDNVGPVCTSLRSCCAGKVEPARSSCEQQYLQARFSADEPTRESTCTSYKPSQSCP